MTRGHSGKAQFATFFLIAGVGVFAMLGLTASSEVSSTDSVFSDADEDVRQRSFDFYHQNIDPLLVRPLCYPNAIGNTSCIICHTWQTSLRFQLENTTDTLDGWAWSEGQSQMSYEVVPQLINTSDPVSSKLVRKPLAAQVGGESHTGGTYWESTDDAEYQVVRDGIEMLLEGPFTPVPELTLDFEFYRSCAQEVFRTRKYGQFKYTERHAGGQQGFAPSPANRTSWTNAETQHGFDVIQRLILSGNPIESCWFLKPLHNESGRSDTHNSVRPWQSMVRDDPMVRAFLGAYSSLIDSVAYGKSDVVFNLGSQPIRFQSGRMIAEGHTDAGRACDPIFYRYFLDPLSDLLPVGERPTYCNDLMESLWGNTDKQIRAHLRSLTFLGHRMLLNKIVVEPLAAIEREILAASKNDDEVSVWIDELKITYSFINKYIAGSQNRSNHAWGLAIDFVPNSYEGQHVYWRWSRVFTQEWHRIPLAQRWSPPQSVIEIFERHGFVWGGKWAHFDNIHFEYRPEIILYNQLISGIEVAAQ